MFAGFNLITDKTFEQYYKIGLGVLEQNKREVKTRLDEFINSDGEIDGTSMQSNWFPQMNADIFISHSHNDEKKVIELVGWLKSEFNINAFVDSAIWGYSEELLKIIDDKYCKKKNGAYDYSLRNYSTSHVHMMLSMALSMMIDNVEAVFLFNTPNSINTYDILHKTASPWIYSEILTTKFVRKKKLSEYRPTLVHEQYNQVESNNKKLMVKYEVSLEHLCELNDSDLDSWLVTWNTQNQNFIGGSIESVKKEYALDKLYVLKNIIQDR